MLIIDKIKKEKAVLAYKGQTFTVPRDILPKKAAKGDILKIIIEEEGIDRTQTEIDKLKNDLFKRR